MESVCPGNVGGRALYGALGQQVVNAPAALQTHSSFPPQARSSPPPCLGELGQVPPQPSVT